MLFVLFLLCYWYSGLSSLHLLVEESKAKHFPDNDLLHHLQEVVQDAERYGALAQQLLNGKRHTRFRSGGGKSSNQLTVAEFRSFVKQLNSFPCIINQAPQLKDLQTRVDEFQLRSHILLTAEMPRARDLQQLLDSSFQFDLDLPLEKLWERLEQARWLEEQEHAWQEPGSLTVDVMRRLIDLGVGLAPHPLVEKAMAKLQEMLTMCEHWDDRCKRLLKARPRNPLSYLTATLLEVEKITAFLPSAELLKDAVQRAQEWLRKVDTLQAGCKVPVLDTLVELVTQGRAIPVDLDPLPRLESLVEEIHAWTDCATNTFLTPNSPYCLLEVLCPRCDFRTFSLKRKIRKIKDLTSNGGRRKYSKPDELKQLERALNENSDTASAMSTLDQARLHEMQSLHALRVCNENRLHFNKDQNDWKVCLCQGPPVAPMIQCELCRACFHLNCITSPPHGPKVWLCPQCHRSKKPPLEKILPLLASLQRLRVRLPEGDALRYLIERTVNWQHRAQYMLSSGNLKPVQEKVRSSHLYNKWQATAGQMEETDKVSQNVGATSFSLPHEWDNRTIYVQSPFSSGRNCIPLTCLTSELDELLMEAQILQVSLPEVQELYQAILTQPNHSVAESILPVSAVGFENGSTKQQGTERNLAQCEVLNYITKKADHTVRKLKRHYRGSEVRMKRASSSRKKRVTVVQSTDLCSREPQSEDTINCDSLCFFTSESDDDNAVCPAEQCFEPEGDEVDWVQCDGSCNRWFHQVCVGISAETAEREDYMCACCNEKVAAASK
ncbi:lysine-specific demethylase 5B [Pelobates cultripes]|uniref:Lysine-specific demethylase 5B n=1 Tax=Pelobates cultripes TaxID=61616 RepID=A0AAD1R0R8_PELCU|nr:lysine-specific demethylase 5B [Pelobates cultripes]